MNTHMKLFIGLVGAAGLWIGMPNPLWQLPAAVLLWPISLLALGRQAADWRRALRAGWLTGLVGASGALYWLAVPVHNVGGLPWILAVPCPLLLGAYIGLYSGLFATLVHLTRNCNPWRQSLLLGLGWYLLEVFRGWFCTGFPWLSLASAFAPWPALLQGAAILGMYGLSGLLTGLACLGFLNPRIRNLPIGLGLAMVGGIFLAVWGWARIPALIQEEERSVSVALIQGNLDQNVKWEPSMQRLTLQRYLTLSAEALAVPAGERPALLIWPETAMPFDYQAHPDYPSRIRTFAADHKVALILGAPGFRRLPSDNVLLFNRAYAISPTGEDTAWYEKTHLVPFGEYTPPYLDIPLLRPLLQGVGTFSPGERTKPLIIQLSPRNSILLPSDGSLVLGMLICYESIFPELARQQVDEGATLLVNISNDAWFGNTSAPEQHLQLSLLRAVEQGRWLLRATNTGISALVDPFGRIRVRGGLFKAEIVEGNIVPRHEVTPFYHLQALLPWSAMIAFLCCLACLFRPMVSVHRTGR